MQNEFIANICVYENAASEMWSVFKYKIKCEELKVEWIFVKDFQMHEKIV